MKWIIVLALVLSVWTIFGSCNNSNGDVDTTTERFSHAYGEWVLTQAPTCTTQGTRERTCSCGERQIQTIDALGHDFSEEWTMDVKPAYDHQGSKSRHCNRCDEKTDIIEIGYMSTGLEYRIEEGTCTILGIGRCDDANLVLPDEIDGYPVTNIGSKAFYGNINLTSVRIGSNVDFIGANAFGLCANLTSVTYDGTIAQWNEIYKEYNWKIDSPFFMVECANGVFYLDYED